MRTVSSKASFGARVLLVRRIYGYSKHPPYPRKKASTLSPFFSSGCCANCEWQLTINWTLHVNNPGSTQSAPRECYAESAKPIFLSPEDVEERVRVWADAIVIRLVAEQNAPCFIQLDDGRHNCIDGITGHAGWCTADVLDTKGLGRAQIVILKDFEMRPRGPWF